MVGHHSPRDQRGRWPLAAAFGIAIVLAGAGASASPAARPRGSTLEEPSNLGERQQKYWQREGAVEVVVDEPGEIYRRRPYKGIIPGIRDSHRRHKKSSKVTTVGPVTVTWVGFQQRAQTSRVFVQLDRAVPVGKPFQPDPYHIVIEIPNARVPRENDRRFVLTHEFNSNVRFVKATRRRGGIVLVVIALKAPVSWIPRQEGPYLFIDVTR